MQPLPSLQVTALPGAQEPALHRSPLVQALPSEQALVRKRAVFGKPFARSGRANRPASALPEPSGPGRPF